MNSGNPTLSNRTFILDSKVGTEKMTMQGTAAKTFFLLSLAFFSAGWVWHAFFITKNFQNITMYMTVGIVGGLIFALSTCLKPTWSPITAPIYALLEGLALGSVSLIFDLRYPGIVIQALPLTFGTLAAMLMLYSSGIIAVNHRFRMIILSATCAIGLVYLLTYILSWVGISLPYIHDNGPVGILFSLVVVGVAAFNLLLDFSFIESGQQYGAPKYMEWYGAFALMVTLVWLYIEILRLLAKFRSRRK